MPGLCGSITWHNLNKYILPQTYHTRWQTTPDSLSAKISGSRSVENNNGESTAPCLVPVMALKVLDKSWRWSKTYLIN